MVTQKHRIATVIASVIIFIVTSSIIMLQGDWQLVYGIGLALNLVVWGMMVLVNTKQRGLNLMKGAISIYAMSVIILVVYAFTL